MARRTAQQLVDQGATAERTAIVAYLLGKVAAIDRRVAGGRLAEDEGKRQRRQLRIAADEVEQGLHL